jgi:hypothetical protein
MGKREEEGGVEEAGEVKRFPWSRVFTYQIWSVLWKLAVLCELVLRGSMQAGAAMFFIVWFYYICLRAHGLLPGRYSYPDGSCWQQNADGARVCVEWPHRFVNGEEWWFNPDDGRGVRFKSPAPAKE